MQSERDTLVMNTCDRARAGNSSHGRPVMVGEVGSVCRRALNFFQAC
jgi:hypothetical protein